MRISRSFITELIDRVDIFELIDSYIPLRKTGRYYAACCPFHAEKTPSFFVFPHTQTYYCFGCEAHGNVVGFLMDYAHLEYVEAIHTLAARVGTEIVYEQGSAPVSTIPKELYEVMAQAAHFYQQQLRQPQAQIAVNYLKSRGLTGKIAAEFGIGYAPLGWHPLLKALAGHQPEKKSLLKKLGLVTEHETHRCYDRFRHRIMFPICDQQGHVIAFGGRILEAHSEPKYLNSPETPLFQKGRELYGLHLARKQRALSKLVVVEGYMDVVALAQQGIRHVVATLGTAVTREQLEKLFRFAPELIFCFDGDEAGHKAAWRALENTLPLLQAGRQVNFTFLPQGSDPDSLIRQEGEQVFRSRLENAMPLSNFLFSTLKKQVNFNSLDGKARLAALAKPLLNQLPAGTYRQLMWHALSQQTGEVLKHTAYKKAAPMPKSFRELPLTHQIIAYLLHQPALSRSMTYPDEKLSYLAQQQTDMKLLLQTIEVTQRNAHLKTGTLCEYWRETEYEAIVTQLASQDFFVDIQLDNLEADFLDAIKQLYQRYDEYRFDFLTKKGVLTAEEKQELQSLRRIS
jgi:DNA primase